MRIENLGPGNASTAAQVDVDAAGHEESRDGFGHDEAVSHPKIGVDSRESGRPETHFLAPYFATGQTHHDDVGDAHEHHDIAQSGQRVREEPRHGGYEDRRERTMLRGGQAGEDAGPSVGAEEFLGHAHVPGFVRECGVGKFEPDVDQSPGESGRRDDRENTEE